MRLIAVLCSLVGVSAYAPLARSALAPPARSRVDMAAGTIRVGDTVKVITGDDKNTVAKVLKVDKKKSMVLVEGVNVKTKHVKPMKEGESGSLQKNEAPIHVSNVAAADPAEVAE